jgi:hypothetical protein
VVVNASLSGQRGEEQGFVAGLNVRALGHLHIESRCRAGHLSTSSFVRLVQGGQLLVTSNNRGDKQQQEGADHFMAVGTRVCVDCVDFGCSHHSWGKATQSVLICVDAVTGEVLTSIGDDARFSLPTSTHRFIYSILVPFKERFIALHT